MESEVLDSINKTKLLKSTEGQETLQEYLSVITAGENARENHITKMERWYKKRYGIRPQVQTFPWRNAANLHLPLIDKMIRRAKPKYMRLFQEVNPIVTLKSNLLNDDLTVVRGMERLFDEELRFTMNFQEKASLGVDMLCEKGYFIAKVVQEFETEQQEDLFKLTDLDPELQQLYIDPNTPDEIIAADLIDRFDFDTEDEDDVKIVRDILEKIKNGETEIRFKRIVVTSNFPSLYIRDPRNIAVPADTTDIRKARQIRDRSFMEKRQIEAHGLSGFWDKQSVDELLTRLQDNDIKNDRYGSAKSEDALEQLEDRREGISPSGSDLEAIDEHYVWYKWPGDRLASKSVITIHKDHPDLPLRFIKYPYVDTKGKQDLWPFVQVRFELTSERYYSARGLPQMLDSIQTELTNNHNAKQNQMTITNNLNLKVKRNANISTSWTPGQPLMVNRMDDCEELQLSPKDNSYDREEQILKAWAEELGGIIDSTLTGPNSLTEPRTKFEIEQVTGIQNDVAFGDVTVFQYGMQKIYEMIWNRLMQYGPDEFTLQGPNGDIKIVSKDEVRRRFKIIPTGNLGNSSREKQKQDAAARWQAFRGDPRINQDELYRQLLVADDERVAELLLVKGAAVQDAQIEKQINEIQQIAMGYVRVPDITDDDEAHIRTIDDYLNDPVKSRTFPQDRLETLLNHRQAHIVGMEKKAKATSRGDRIQQEMVQIANGAEGREAREVPGV